MLWPTAPDVILMDMLLKGPMNGIQAARDIRSQCRCPLIYVTAQSDRSILDLAEIAKPSGWVPKPVNELELRTAIEEALHQPRMEEPSRAWPPRVHELSTD